MESAVDRHVFYISDGTAITAEVLGHAVMSQFPVAISSFTLPFVENISRARAVKEQIDAIYPADRHPPAGVLLHRAAGNPRYHPTKRRLLSGYRPGAGGPPAAGAAPRSTPIAHRTHGLTPGNLNKYDARIAAIDYTLAHDDGISLRNLDQAQVILLGVSRCGKTPTSLYLAMQYGIRAANYPFIADDMDNLILPASLKPLQHKLFGLTINPERLAAIREERRENSRYASMRQCRMEVTEVEALYRKNKIPCLNSTNYSVEEIATKIMDIMGLSRRMY